VTRLEVAAWLFDDVDGFKVRATVQSQHRVHRQLGELVLCLRDQWATLSNDASCLRQSVGVGFVGSLASSCMLARVIGRRATGDGSTNSKHPFS